MKHILFVCTGNSCRSVMAEGLFRKLVSDRSGEFSVSSAGINAYEGAGPTKETVDVMRSEGIDVTHHRARRATREILGAADLILVMEKAHRDVIQRTCPETIEKMYLLSRFSQDPVRSASEADIPDPIGLSAEFYQRVLNLIRSSIEELIKKL